MNIIKFGYFILLIIITIFTLSFGIVNLQRFNNFAIGYIIVSIIISTLYLIGIKYLQNKNQEYNNNSGIFLRNKCEECNTLIIRQGTEEAHLGYCPNKNCSKFAKTINIEN